MELVSQWRHEVHPDAESLLLLLKHEEEGKGDSKEDCGANGVGSVAKEGDQDPSQDVVVHSWRESCRQRRPAFRGHHGLPDVARVKPDAKAKKAATEEGVFLVRIRDF